MVLICLFPSGIRKEALKTQSDVVKTHSGWVGTPRYLPCVWGSFTLSLAVDLLRHLWITCSPLVEGFRNGSRGASGVPDGLWHLLSCLSHQLVWASNAPSDLPRRERGVSQLSPVSHTVELLDHFKHCAGFLAHKRKYDSTSQWVPEASTDLKINIIFTLHAMLTRSFNEHLLQMRVMYS